jgi:hypothetical protein
MDFEDMDRLLPGLEQDLAAMDVDIGAFAFDLAGSSKAEQRGADEEALEEALRSIEEGKFDLDTFMLPGRQCQCFALLCLALYVTVGSLIE